MTAPLKYFFRTFTRDKQFSFLNLAGLSTGLACAILVYLWVQDEIHTDKFNKHDDRLYQVVKTFVTDEKNIEASFHTPGIMAAELKKDYPEIEMAVPVVHEFTKGLLGTDAKKIKATAWYAGDEYFKIFSYPLIEGNKKTVMTDEKGVVISTATAMRLFNTTSGLVGKTIDWITTDKIAGPYTITGVFENPENASKQCDIIFSFRHYFNTFRSQYGLDKWYSNNPATYVLLKEGVDIDVFNKKIKEFSRNKMLAAEGPENLQYEGPMYLQKFSDTYLYNRFDNGKVAGGRIVYVQLFTIIGILIILIACINFMNLSTAKAASHVREAGIRKLVGANRATLIMWHIMQSVLMSFLGLVIALILVYALLPQFSAITQKSLSLSLDATTIVALLLITAITGVLSGSYPAAYLTSFKPAWVLKGSHQFSGGQSMFRKALVVGQFTLSIIFIVAVVVIYRQMNLIQEKNLGFEKNNTISFSAEGRVMKDMPSFIAELKKLPGVMNASGMSGDFVGYHSGGGGVEWEGKGNNAIEFAGFYVNTGWTETFEVPVVEGRTFISAADSMGVLFNETAIRMMRLKNPVGRKVTMWGKECRIVGVMKDFHYESLYNKPGPFFVRYERENETVVAKIAAGSLPQTIDKIKNLYSQFNSGVPFDFRFIEDDFNKLYASEQRVAQLSKYFASLAIVISCLGLFGLAAFTANKRKKEIGVRKVLGASMQQIAVMLSGGFLKLVIVALLVACPVAWWLMNTWLMDFQYRISITTDIFILTAAATITITLFTISFQAIHASLSNPVDSLRTE